MKKIVIIIMVCSTLAGLTASVAQDLYSARGYWTELNKETYRKISEKKTKGDTLTASEQSYLTDYEVYLETYYNRMSDTEKTKYEQMKTQWDLELTQPQASQPETDFEFRGRDRLVNGVYGFYYGLSVVGIAEIDNAAAIGIPLITAGLWQLGPVINHKKYENITLSTIRASNTGKFLGLLNGAALGLTIGGESDNTGKLALAFSSIGSIALGEIAFQRQKNKPVTEGHIEMMRHYGLLGPSVAFLGYSATNPDNVNLIGASLLAGGVGGLFIGNKVAKNYDYSAGDVRTISSLTLITTGLGLAFAVESFDSEENFGLLLIPAATAIAGTIFGQRAVKGAHFTKKQGSTIGLASGGSALVGLGIVLLAESDSPGVIIGVPSVLALVTHQLLFHSYKKKNLEAGINLRSSARNPVQFTVRATPENYFVNKQLKPENIIVNDNFPKLANPIINLKLTF